MFLSKKCQFLLYLDLVKLRLKIMLKDFAQGKKTFLGNKKHNFQKSKNSHFSKGVNPCFWSETRLEIILNAFVEKEETFFDYNNNISQSPKNRFFQRG